MGLFPENERELLRESLSNVRIARICYLSLSGKLLIMPKLEHLAGNFEIVKTLSEHGQSGTATVYLAKDNNFYPIPRLVVIKILSNEYFQLIFEESVRWKELHHTNIASILSITDYKGLPALVLEYVEDALCLTDYIAEHKLDKEAILGLFRQIASGLQHMHEQGVVHGDLKPQNILVNGKGVVKIIDLGWMPGMASPPFWTANHLAETTLEPNDDWFVLGLLFKICNLKESQLKDVSLVLEKCSENPNLMANLLGSKAFQIGSKSEKIFQRLTNYAVDSNGKGKLFETKKNRMGLTVLLMVATAVFSFFFFKEAPLPEELELIEKIKAQVKYSPDFENLVADQIKSFSSSKNYDEIVRSFAEYKKKFHPIRFKPNKISIPKAVIIGPKDYIFYGNVALSVGNWVSETAYVNEIFVDRVVIVDNRTKNSFFYEVDFKPQDYAIAYRENTLSGILLDLHKLTNFALLFDCSLQGIGAGLNKIEGSRIRWYGPKDMNLSGLIRADENGSILRALIHQIEPDFFSKEDENLVDYSKISSGKLWYFNPYDDSEGVLEKLVLELNKQKIVVRPGVKRQKLKIRNFIPWRQVVKESFVSALIDEKQDEIIVYPEVN